MMVSKIKCWSSIGLVLLLTGIMPGLTYQLRRVEAGIAQSATTQPKSTLPVITSLSNNFGKPYDNIFIRGTGFGPAVKKVKVLLSQNVGKRQQTMEAYVVACEPKQIKIRLPQLKPGLYKLLVQTKTGSSKLQNFRMVLGPQVNTSTLVTKAGAKLEISGSGFKFSGLEVKLLNGGLNYGLAPTKVEETKLTLKIPAEIKPGRYLLRITSDAGMSKDKVIIIGVQPKINNLLPKSSLPGKHIYIYGKNLTLGSMPKVQFNTTPAKVITYSSTKLLVQVPQVSAADYLVTVFNGYGNSNAITFRVR